ncbi:hypothetical protein DFH06DRAFT_379845 [Mycena polygramma]|nr:hypothetical protein DFH06DRAFT_379845 [Mycena polygramma]
MLASLERDRVRVTELEAQIMQLERSLAALKNEKVSVQGRLDSYKYPVLTLPNELTSKIFIHFLPLYPLCPPLAGPRSPTLLAQICRRWREIALGTPSLWRALLYNVWPLPKDAQFLHLWLNRSHSYPLSLHLYCNNEDASAVLLAAASHRTRWEHAELCLSPSQIPIIGGPMPLLRRLDLGIDAPCTSLLTITFSEMPLLRTVTLNDYAAASIVLPWAQLTSLTLYAVYPSECTPVLQQTPNLIHCHLRLNYHSGRDDGPQPDVALLHLKSFILRGAVSAPGHLQTFITPALKRLKVSSSALWPNAIEEFKLFVSKSGCSIQKASIMELPYASHMTAFRDAFPSIQFFFGDDDEEDWEM